jgi:hypothetical protein
MNPGPTNPTPPNARAMTLLAVSCGFVFAVVMVWQMSPRETGGPVVFTYGQSSSSAGVVFELPPGWKIVRNGHQPWHGGSVVDTSGRPRMEVWLHPLTNPTPPAGNEVVTFVWGTARCFTQKSEMARPFNSFPRVAECGVVTRDFYLDQGMLSFRVVAKEDDEMKRVVHFCMDSLRPQPGN